MKPLRLELDYVAAPRRARTLQLALLAASIACAIAVLLCYRDTKRQLTSAESARTLAPAERLATPRRGTDEEWKQAEAVVRQLALPWAAMIQSAEAAASAEVALLQMEPDARERRLRLTAEAKDEQTMIDYLRRLARAGALADVHLAAHQVVPDNAQRPLQFTALARLR